MNSSVGNPLAPAVAGSQIAADQIAAQRAKREIRKMRGTDDSMPDVRAIEDPVAIQEIHNQDQGEPPPDRKKKNPNDEDHQLDLTA